MKSSRLRWLMISLAFAATVINYLDRQTLSVAAPVLIERFHMSAVSYSRVLFAFLMAYTIMNGISGPLIDRLGTRRGYAACMAWWSGSSVLHALARGPLSLGLFRFLLGMGEAGNWPAALKIVAEWFPAKERALASGLFNSGSAVGSVIAPPLVAWLITAWGWQAGFFAIGLLGFVWLLFWFAIYRSPQTVERGARPRRIPVSELIRERFIVNFTVSKIFFDPVWYFYIFWFPEYLKHARNFDLAAIGRYAWIPFAVAGLGNIAGGLLSSFFLRRGMRLADARRAALTVFAICMASAAPAVLVSSPWWSIAFASVAMAGYTGGLANILALPTDLYPAEAVASVYGLASMGAGFGGMLFTLMTGWMVDHYSYVPVFFVFGSLAFVCAAILWFTKMS